MTTEPLDLAEITKKWLNQCGVCDVGLPEFYPCTCPSEDYRPVMLDLVREVERLRALVPDPYPVPTRGRYSAGRENGRLMTTKIEWTRGDDGMPGMTWNPTTGCDRISPGCDNCYALTMAKRLKAMGSAKYQTDGDPRTSGPGFGLVAHGDALTIPLRWRDPRRVFVNSMSDLFHARVPRDFVTRVWAVMAATPQHTYQILTKRPERMERMLIDLCQCGSGHVPGVHFRSDMDWAATRHSGAYVPGVTSTYHTAPWPLANVWLGTSIESDDYARRADHLRETPAAVRFVSAEPLLGPLPSLDLTGIDWLIIGGESGKGARPLELAWVSDLIERARDAKTAVFVKQLGSVWVHDVSVGSRLASRTDSKGGNPDFWPAEFKIREWPPGGGA